MQSVTVEKLVEPTGTRWQVKVAGQVSLLTQGATARDWAKVERHVRAAMEQPTAAERWATEMDRLVEQYGTEHPLGAAAYSALIEAGMD